MSTIAKSCDRSTEHFCVLLLCIKTEITKKCYHIYNNRYISTEKKAQNLRNTLNGMLKSDMQNAT